MKLRLATMDDLPQLKSVYRRIIEDMNRKQVPIWDEIYPCEVFQEDIESNRLFLLDGDPDIIAAFALCDSCPGESHVKWADAQGSAFYLDRFGVNVKYAGKGFGSRMLKHAAALAKDRGAGYLRLFVVDINQPAINLYIKNGFKKAEGIYEEKIDDSLVLFEYGFEIETSGRCE